ncbi:MAG: 50S ribosomal protein L6 [Pyrinomonadaceae bacterium]|nr:50S ribosomal protein L6 [Pyrinomonadaceae bacterium]
MSRVGNQPITLPDGVTVTIHDTEIEVKGPKGQLSSPIPKDIEFSQEDGILTAKRKNESASAMHGLARALANNAVLGVTEGFSKQMDLVGVGYKADVKGRKLVFALGYSHPVEYELPEGIDATTERLNTKSEIQQYQTTITLSGIDKQKLGQVAAELAHLRKPDAYKGKGIRYADRYYRLKQGKAAASA